MIDLVSTRPGVDPQSAACARFLASVIATAVQDACEAPLRHEIKEGKNLCTIPRSAIRFLFGTHSVFPLYAELIGLSAESIRMALVDGESGINDDRRLSESHRRAIRWRARVFLSDPEEDVPDAPGEVVYEDTDPSLEPPEEGYEVDPAGTFTRPTHRPRVGLPSQSHA